MTVWVTFFSLFISCLVQVLSGDSLNNLFGGTLQNFLLLQKIAANPSTWNVKVVPKRKEGQYLPPPPVPPFRPTFLYRGSQMSTIELVGKNN